MSELDPENKQLWRANRKRLSIEELRDAMLAVAGRLDLTQLGRSAPLWGEGYTRRRAIYGYINRFNLDPTLRVFDFPTPMQTQAGRGESIVAPQALFTLNSPFVIDQALAITAVDSFTGCESDEQRARALFQTVYQRDPTDREVTRAQRFVDAQHKFFRQPDGRITSPWPLAAQALLMSNEFQYLD